ncbi:MAG: hypothetical protein IKO94_05320, partial [Selenomonadaceae bacterium]|nr:hypothetical protein [Selenomonadaceae bacterium]
MEGIIYKDSRGWLYKVMPGLGEGCFKARYHKPERAKDTGGKCMASMPWRETFEDAQKDLDELAAKKKWSIY